MGHVTTVIDRRTVNQEILSSNPQNELSPVMASCESSHLAPRYPMANELSEWIHFILSRITPMTTCA